MGSIDRLDSLLDAPYDLAEQEADISNPVVEWPADKIDPRLARQSYSSSLLLNGCARKYQLTKMSAKKVPGSEESWQQTLTFQYGHTVGEAIQDALVATKSRERIIFDLFAGWKCDLFEENVKQKKSFFHALAALYKFWALQDDGLYADYEVAIYNGVPAAELSFRIKFPNGGSYRGYVDLVLRHKYTGEYVILEMKTNSGNTINPNQYKNSAQAIGYSVVLDKIQPGLTSYTVEYLVYMTRLERWEPFSFPKTYVQRALWVRDRLWDQQILDTLAAQETNHGIWPMNGNNCVAWNRDCEFMGICHMNTEALVEPLRQSDLTEDKEYQFEFTIEELIE